MAKMKKLLACMLAFVVLFSCIPVTEAKAAALPKFKTTYANLYENNAQNGVYLYTLQNVKKGQIVKWSVSGKGKDYVSLKYEQRKVTGSTSSNKLTIKTNGNAAAKNKKVKLTAKIYSSTGVLQYTVQTSGKIKVKPKSIAITGSGVLEANYLYVGNTYRLGSTITPGNSTSKNVWSVKDENGVDYSAYITQDGVFTPRQAGSYVITLRAMIGTKEIRKDSVEVDVADYMTNLSQISVNSIRLTYTGDISEVLDASDIKIKADDGTSIVGKDEVYSNDGKTMTVTTYTNFKHNTRYTVTDGVKSLAFTASAGAPTQLVAYTYQVTVNKETKIDYAVLDENGIDVSLLYPGTVKFEPMITNGYLSDDNRLVMKTVGSTGTVKMTYTTEVPPLTLQTEFSVTCIEAPSANKTNFTVTNSATAPNFESASHKDVRKAYTDTTAYAHFRALDSDGEVIHYSNLKYTSTNPDALIITPTGKITPIEEGTVTIIVSGEYGGEEYTYSFDVTVSEPGCLDKVALDSYSVTMSNVYSSDYKKIINMTATDQYGENFPLANEYVTITPTGTSTLKFVTYNSATNQFTVKPTSGVTGTYNYLITVTCDGDQATANLSVTIVSLPTSGSYTYKMELSQNTVDLKLDAATTGSKSVDVRLAQYRGGVFASYTSFASATITKGGKYYNSDLTTGGSTTTRTINGSSRLSIFAETISANNVCTKAETGTYTITFRYYSQEAKAYETQTVNLVVTDSSNKVRAEVVRTTTSKSCATALEMAQDCIKLSEGTITECSVTGESVLGSAVKVVSGDQKHISTVTVVTTDVIANGITVTTTYTIPITKTITNK